MQSVEKETKKTKLHILNLFLLLFLLSSLMVNQVLLGKVEVKMGMNRQGIMEHFLSFSFLGIDTSNKIKLSGNLSDDVAKLAISNGMPAIYGAELNISFDNVEPSMNIMKQFDPTYGNNKLSMSSTEMERYTKIGLMISCEYCCSAQTLVFQNGEAACGCAHSQAMRGLLSYLIKNHGNEYSDDQLLRELSRWKGRYFPKQMMAKLASQIQSGNYTQDSSSLLLDVTLPKYSGANADVPLPSDLPSMVGGC